MHEFNARLKIAQEELDNALDVLRPLVADRLENNAGSSSLSLDTLAFHPPVIDEYGGPWRSDDVVGLRKYVDGLEDTANALRKVCVDESLTIRCPDHPSRHYWQHAYSHEVC